MGKGGREVRSAGLVVHVYGTPRSWRALSIWAVSSKTRDFYWFDLVADALGASCTVLRVGWSLAVSFKDVRIDCTRNGPTLVGMMLGRMTSLGTDDPDQLTGLNKNRSVWGPGTSSLPKPDWSS